MTVVTFPPERFAKNMQRHLNEFFRDMAEKGYTQEQMNAVLFKSLKEIGAVEIDGVWQMPAETS